MTLLNILKRYFIFLSNLNIKVKTEFFSFYHLDPQCGQYFAEILLDILPQSPHRAATGGGRPAAVGLLRLY